MEVKEILSKCDHTLLAQTATWEEIKAICDDGMKYGYFKSTNIILSQSLAIVCTNAMIYLQISLLSARLVEILPIVILILFEVLISILWTNIVHYLFKKMFPPREMLLIYEDYAVDDILRKMQLMHLKN